jgi:predicted hotdog family 3-hydroxylacyl-ACP dehydratase
MAELLADRSFVTSCLPHGDGMCLLDGVLAWDETMIECVTTAATPAQHPLSRGGHLHAIMAAEYAAQATAIHGALRAPDTPPMEGRLAGIRELAWEAAELTASRPARVYCFERMRQQQALIYGFELSDQHNRLVSGEVTVAFPETRS